MLLLPCVYCNYLDTITHHLFECGEVKTFWNQVQLWILERLRVKFNPASGIVFGISAPEELTRVVNYIKYSVQRLYQ